MTTTRVIRGQRTATSGPGEYTACTIITSIACSQGLYTRIARWMGNPKHIHVSEELPLTTTVPVPGNDWSSLSRAVDPRRFLKGGWPVQPTGTRGKTLTATKARTRMTAGDSSTSCRASAWTSASPRRPFPGCASRSRNSCRNMARNVPCSSRSMTDTTFRVRLPSRKQPRATQARKRCWSRREPRRRRRARRGRGYRTRGPCATAWITTSRCLATALNLR
mmetsp:Transcript_4209/g.14020  ORF Transcript_4209/g.14020 Transcript_4209/m.14020 type:complete len:221 (+) Transcript_4209:199-861(+)